jgi:hypothetical protein
VTASEYGSSNGGDPREPRDPFCRIPVVPVQFFIEDNYDTRASSFLHAMVMR